MFYIVHLKSNQRVMRQYKKAGSAKAAMTRSPKKYPAEDFAVMSVDEWAAADVEVETYNMMDPDRKVIMIRKSQKGTCVDPATERYHSM